MATLLGEQEFTVKTWQPWIDKSTEDAIRDEHGNFKGSVTFVEYPESVDATFKQQPSAGDKKYGTIDTYTTRAGKDRAKFTRLDRPQTTSNKTRDIPPYKDQAAINAGVAVKVAAMTSPPEGGWSRDKFKTRAQEVMTIMGELAEEAKAKETKPLSLDLPPEIVADVTGEPIDLNDIPF